MYLSVLLYFFLLFCAVYYNHNNSETPLTHIDKILEFIMTNVNTTFAKKVLFIAGISALALTDMATAVAYMGVEDTLFMGDAIVSNLA